MVEDDGGGEVARVREMVEDENVHDAFLSKFRIRVF
jgi:hypothetical protein